MVLLSEQQLVDCAGAYDNHGCKGGLPSHAFEYIASAGGLDTEAAYPYLAEETGSCDFAPRGIGADVIQAVNITFQDEAELLEAVGNTGPVSVAFQVYSAARRCKEYAKLSVPLFVVQCFAVSLFLGSVLQPGERFYVLSNPLPPTDIPHIGIRFWGVEDCRPLKEVHQVDLDPEGSVFGS